jgi:PAS domain S-box-containing protein/diguanylate cyclase (GGDEF)-like protein
MKPRLRTVREDAAWESGPRPSVWLVLPLAILLAGATIFGIYGSANRLADRREAEAFASDLSSLVTTTHSAKTAQTGPTPGSELEAGRAIIQLEPSVRGLEQIGPSSQTQAVRAAFDKLAQDVTAGEQAIITGQQDAAQVNATIGASSQALISAIDAAHASMQDATASAQRQLTIFAAAIFAITGASVAGLILLLGRNRNLTTTASKRQSAHFRAMTTHSGDVISLIDRKGVVRLQSSSLLRILGRSDLWLMGRPFADIVHEEDRPHLAETIQAAVDRPGEPAHGRLRLAHGDGSYRSVDLTAVVPMEQPEIEGVLLTCRSVPEPVVVPMATTVSDAAAIEETGLQHPVSGMLNEAAFRDRLNHALTRTARSADPVGLLIVELGGEQTFAGLSDDAQAATLRAITGRLARSIRGADSIAHLQGLEFAVILEETDLETARTIARRIFEQLQLPVAHLNGRIRLTPRIGIAVKTDPRDNVDTLLLDARTALSGRMPVEATTPPRRGRAAQPAADLATAPETVVDRPATMPAPAGSVVASKPAVAVEDSPVAVVPQTHASAREPVSTAAFDASEFDLQFVPVLALETGEIVELETLVRWRHPQRGWVPVEQSGKLDQVMPWVLKQACRLAPTLPATRSGAHVRISVNVSPLTPLDDQLVDAVAAPLLTTGIDPASLQLEIAARALDSGDSETVLRTLGQLRSLGVRLTLDGAAAEADRLPDFDRLPVHGVKIDRSVVTLLDRSADRRSLVREVVERARANGVAVTGVGVETLEQAERLWDLGADAGQGPLFFRPIQEAQLAALFATEPALVAAAD